MGHRLPSLWKTFSREALRAQIEKGSDQYLPEFLTSEDIKRVGKELDDCRSKLFKDGYLPRVRPFPRVRELFQRLHDGDKQIVLATSGKESEAKHYIKLLKIGDLIEAYTTADDAEKSKPAPDIFVAARDKIKNVRGKQVLVVGDTRFDLDAARRAGLSAAGFTCGGTSAAILRQAGAIGTYRDPADFLSAYSSS